MQAQSNVVKCSKSGKEVGITIKAQEMNFYNILDEAQVLFLEHTWN